jgi:tRNA (guanine37-N1)-methyltransferase
MRWANSPALIGATDRRPVAMQIHVITIFPELFAPSLDVGIVGRAIRTGMARVDVHDLRDHTHDRHRSVDDSPFGGGPGMVLRPEPLYEAVEALALDEGGPVVLLSPQGKPYTQQHAEHLSKEPVVTLICGRYEGVDERVRMGLVTEEISIGDYVLTGGEIAALVLIDSMVRLLPGALGHGDEALEDDSHTSGLLQYPQYTRPATYREMETPPVLLSGDHAAVARWRRREALRRTLERRPDMLDTAELSASDITDLESLEKDQETSS